MDGLLRLRAGDLVGIINGIDYDAYDPMKDEHLAMNYNVSLQKKRKNKLAFQQENGLVQDEGIPMIGIVSRLVEQKGLDLVEWKLNEILQMNIQMAVLGTGEWKYEQLFKYMQNQYPEKLSVHIEFNEAKAKKIYASSDLFLMPSRFEPCGIGQLIALRYRSAPIVRETGGLKDMLRFDQWRYILVANTLRG